MTLKKPPEDSQLVKMQRILNGTMHIHQQNFCITKKSHPILKELTEEGEEISQEAETAEEYF